ncbi:MAG: AGE family epimerase/isomerase [Gemmata sp.]
MDVTTPQGRAALAETYRGALLGDVIPFWMRHGLDREHGGYLTALDRDGTVIDTDKSVWFQGRGAWTFATLFNTVARNPEWLDAAKSGIEFLRRHAAAADGKLYFTVTRDGRPLRLRRYVYSEAFAAMANAVYARTTGDGRAASEAIRYFGTYLDHSFTPGRMPPKVEPATRPAKGVGPLMFSLLTAQEVREHLGDHTVRGRTCTEWIDWSIAEIERDFLKPEHKALMEVVAPDGSVIDHFDGRQLNPGHAIECAWFVMHEGRLRSDPRLIRLGLTILDWMWARGWDDEHGGLFYFRDLRGLPVQDYWHDMKFWWPHCEAVIATLLAWRVTGDEKYARWHRQVHDWSFRHFPDPEFGEWYGYLHRDGRVSVRLKGNMWKGPYHLPRMLWYCWQLLQ